MFGQCKRRDSVPAGYRSLRDALTVLIEAETSGQTTLRHPLIFYFGIFGRCFDNREARA